MRCESERAGARLALPSSGRESARSPGDAFVGAPDRCQNASIFPGKTPLDEITLRPATELAAALAWREIGARELLERCLERVERLNPALNAVVLLDPGRARAAADAADAAAARGETKGPLHGLPVTIKDTLETAGMRTTAGARPYAAHVPERNAVAVQRLVDAGAIVYGKTNTPPFAGDTQTYNEIYGVTNNPWDPARTPGGSSGGSAAAVAAGFTAFELGSDIAGSIRNPAHYCGVYGHKPTWGIVPSRGHIPGPPGTLAPSDISVVGPLARSATDLDLILGIIAGPQPEQGIAWRLALPPPRHQRLGDYRIAAWLDDDDIPTDAAVGNALEETVRALERAGARVDTRARPAFRLRDAFTDFLRLLWPVTTGRVPEKTFERLRAEAAQSAPDDGSARARLARFSTVTHREWLAANEARERYRAAWQAFFGEYDVLLTPVTPVCAPPHDHSKDMLARTITVNGATRWYWEQIAWAGLVGMAYLPATVAPVGLADNCGTADGLPVGVQIVGPYLEDRTPIDFAARLADVIGGFVPPPGYL